MWRLFFCADNDVGYGTYTYDGLDRWISKTVNGANTYFLYDGNNLIADQDVSGGISTPYQYGHFGEPQPSILVLQILRLTMLENSGYWSTIAVDFGRSQEKVHRRLDDITDLGSFTKVRRINLGGQKT